MALDYKKILTGIANKWPIKVLSVVAAMFLFVFHRMGDMQERFFSLPLQLNINSNLTPGSLYPRNIRISVRGDADSVYLITEDDFDVFLDLSQYSEPGTYRAPVQIQKKNSSAETEALEIKLEPMEVSLELDTRVSKYVPLSPDFEGYPEPGYELVSYTISPNQVVVDGPLKLLAGISELFTESLDLQNRNTDFSLSLRILNPNPLLIIRGEGVAEFRGFIREPIIIRSFDNLPVSPQGLSGDMEVVLHPPAVLVRIQGGNQEELNSLDGQNITVTVDCSALTEPGTYTLPLSVSVPSNLSLDRVEPETVEAVLGFREGGEEQ
jgi:YbbR domain-containing protein